MAKVLPESTRGILDARTAFQAFRLTKVAPSPGLAPYVEYYWVLVWDLRGREPHRQQILTRPTVHMTFTHYLTSGLRRSRIMGVVRDEFVEEIHDEGHVVGVGFLPGAFRPFLGSPVSAITGRELRVDEVFGDAGRV
ncbi:DUF6597 domain-containing transcriptional factor, partial [Actinomadura adrarensis]